MKRWLSILIKILITVVIIIVVLIVFALVDNTAIQTEPVATSSETITSPPTAVQPQTPKPTQSATPTPTPAYIPSPDELQGFELSELSISSSRIKYKVAYGGLVAQWDIVSDADYCILYALDENDVVYHKDILWPDIDSWSVSGIRKGSLLLLFYQDMGQIGVADDILLDALLEPLVEDDSMFSSVVSLQNKYYIIIDKEDFTIGIFTYDETGEYTKFVKAFPCATGRSSRMTALGTFEISSKGAWKKWNTGQYSPYYTKYTAGVYIHGPIYRSKKFDSLLSKSYNAIGTKSTSGCIRTTVEASMWIYFECPAGTVIEVVETSDKVDHVEKIPLNEDYPRWDPTDENIPVNESE